MNILSKVSNILINESNNFVLYGLTPNDLFDVQKKRSKDVKMEKSSLLNKVRFIINNLNLLSVKFISISNNLTSIFEKLLEKHQIQVNKYMSGEYIQSFFGTDITELSIMASKLKNGLNKNEITLVSKNIENKGFFEKFFQLFS